MGPYNDNPGGSANMPPFGAEPPAMETAADHQLPPADTAGSAGRPATGAPSASGTGDADAADESPWSRSGTADSPLEAAEAAADAAVESAAESAGVTRRKLGELGDQLEDSVNQQMHRTAEQLGSAAEQIDRFADERTRGATGVKAQAGSMARSVADTLDSASAYLRDNDVESLRASLGRQMRERPLQTLLIGVAAGWVVGKILR